MCQRQLSRSNSVCTQCAWCITRKVLTDRLQWLRARIQFPGKPLLMYYMILKLPNTTLLHLCFLLPSVPSLCSVKNIPDIHKFSLTRNSEPSQVQHLPGNSKFVASFFRHMSFVEILVTDTLCGLFALSLQSKYISCGRMSSESVFLVAFAVSCFFTVKSYSPTPHMNGSWLPCLILSQNPHGLPKLISKKYTDVLRNPLRTPMMLAHAIACKKTFLILSRVTYFSFLCSCGVYSEWHTVSSCFSC